MKIGRANYTEQQLETEETKPRLHPQTSNWNIQSRKARRGPASRKDGTPVGEGDTGCLQIGLNRLFFASTKKQTLPRFS